MRHIERSFLGMNTRWLLKVFALSMLREKTHFGRSKIAKNYVFVNSKVGMKKRLRGASFWFKFRVGERIISSPLS